MAHIPFLNELALIAGLGVVMTLLLARLKLPTVAGLLLVGALIGPAGLGFVRQEGSIEVLAEIGVVLLLFTIGLEFSLERLRHIFRQVLLGGLAQVVLTAVGTAAVSSAMGRPLAQGVLFGFIFALSSTAIVLRFLADRRELDAPHGRFIVGTLIFQDLCVVPMVLIVPLLGRAAVGGPVVWAIGSALLKASGVVVATIAIARLLVPRVLGWVDASRSREIFLLAVLALCIGTAWLTSLAGLSLALGAFLGGMVISDTEYGHRAMSEMLPLRDAFVSLFFVSLGMLFDARVVWQHPLSVAVLLAGFLFGKGLLATLAVLLMRFPARVAWLAGVGLAQFGEFGFVLAKLGEAANVLDVETSRQLLAAGVISMFLTPALVGIAPHVSAGERLLAPLSRLLGARSIHEADSRHSISDHVVVVGYGVAGRLVVQALSQAQVPYVVLELNAEVVRQSRRSGLSIYYADATSPEALGHAHLPAAKALVLLMNDPAATKRVIDVARRVAPHVPVMTRARYLGERDYLQRIGADEVIAEEVEGGVEMVARLLRRLTVPRNVILRSLREARDQTQQSARAATLPCPTLAQHARLANLKIESVQIETTSPSVGMSAAALKLRSATSALIVALEREGVVIEAPSPHESLRSGDVVYLVGSKQATRRATSLLLGAQADSGGESADSPTLLQADGHDGKPTR
ncbi:MAG: cation:proton antiporter [Myxococcales bacterium]|nr:cation:proton antiporter [Myxococcales bacterium]